MNDQAIEQEIQAKGKTAPRVTPADIEANIAGEYYFTAGAATVASAIPEHFQTLDLLTFCVLVLRNGFTVTGESACASPENFDAEIGRNIARQNAVQKIWPLMGYQLRDELHRRAQFAAEPKTSDEARMQKHIDMVRESGWTPGDDAGQQTAPAPGAAFLGYSTMQPHQQRVVDEKAELDERAGKLHTFINTSRFADLDEAEQHRMRAQFVAMKTYSDILDERIAAFSPAIRVASLPASALSAHMPT